jgi:hypothetical protein
MSVNKDRPGGLRRYCPDTGNVPPPAGLFRLVAAGDGSLSWSVSTPVAEDAETPDEDRPASDAERDADALADLTPLPSSQRDVQRRMRWGGTRAADALRVLRERSGSEQSAPSAPTPGGAERGAEHTDGQGVRQQAHRSACAVAGCDSQPTEIQRLDGTPWRVCHPHRDPSRLSPNGDGQLRHTPTADPRDGSDSHGGPLL